MLLQVHRARTYRMVKVVHTTCLKAKLSHFLNVVWPWNLHRFFQLFKSMILVCLKWAVLLYHVMYKNSGAEKVHQENSFSKLSFCVRIKIRSFIPRYTSNTLNTIFTLCSYEILFRTCQISYTFFHTHLYWRPIIVELLMIICRAN